MTAGEGVREPIEAMPGIERLSISEAVAEVTEIAAAGVRAVILFGIPAQKDEYGTEAYDDEGVVQMAVRALKEAHPEVVVITDVCLCEYTASGQCGVVREGATRRRRQRPHRRALAKTAISHAAAGADAVAPSDMMDGRVGIDPPPARRGGALRGPDHRLQRQVRLGLLRALSRGGRLDARSRRPPRLPDGPRQRRGGRARGPARPGGGGRRGHGQAGAALPRRRPPGQGRDRARPSRPTTSAASTRC